MTRQEAVEIAADASPCLDTRVRYSALLHRVPCWQPRQLTGGPIEWEWWLESTGSLAGAFLISWASHRMLFPAGLDPRALCTMRCAARCRPISAYHGQRYDCLIVLYTGTVARLFGPDRATGTKNRDVPRRLMISQLFHIDIDDVLVVRCTIEIVRSASS